jgi:hypothetical protein
MEKSFRFIAEKVYSLPGRGVVVTGKVENGSVSVGEEIGLLGTDGQWASALVVGIEVSRRLVEEATAGQQASLLLEGVRKEQITLGTILMEMPATPAPVSSSSPQLPSQPAVSIPSAPSLGKAIHPSSSLGRTVLFAVIGILIILAILYLQGKLDRINPIKRIASYQLSTFNQGGFLSTFIGGNLRPYKLMEE